MGTELKVTLDAEALREATVQAINGSLTPELRQRILSDAIRALLTPSTDSWRRNKSPLEEAFEHAVQLVAREESLRLVREDNEVSTRISALLREAAMKLVTVDAEKLSEQIASAFIAAIRRE